MATADPSSPKIETSAPEVENLSPKIENSSPKVEDSSAKVETSSIVASHEASSIVGAPLPAPLPDLENEEPTVYPGKAKAAVIMASLYISIFLVALDRTILGTAIPRITDQFHSVDSIGWLGSAYMLTACGFILVYGRVYTFFNTKWVFLSGILIFETGSALCGAAPNSTALIVGRAIAGFGSSGIFTGAIQIMLNTIPLHQRPLWQGLFGACFGIASVAGPLLGGAFTESKATWRWCFYINLPLGALTILIILLFLHIDEKKPVMTLRKKLTMLDPLGMSLFLPSIICLLLALQWGGSKYPWSDGRIIALLVIFALLFLAFIAVQTVTRHTTALVPSRIILQRSVAFGALFQFCVGSAMMTAVLYLPLWFQAIRGSTAVKSGIQTIPLVLSLVAGSITCGALVHRLGYYTQFMYLGSILMSIGGGLLTTMTGATNHSGWIGYEVLFGLGIGSSMQQSNLAVQVVLPKRDVPTGISVIFFFQTLGGAVFVSVGQNVFLNKFLTQLGDLPGVNPNIVISTGATALKDHVPRELLPRVLEAYNYALTHGPFLVTAIVACLTIFGAIGMEWRSVKEGQPPKASKNAVKDVESGSLDERSVAEGEKKAALN
jgi:EmrB/QacA subfamily drug resistance transporter